MIIQFLRNIYDVIAKDMTILFVDFIGAGLYLFLGSLHIMKFVADVGNNVQELVLREEMVHTCKDLQKLRALQRQTTVKNCRNFFGYDFFREKIINIFFGQPVCQNNASIRCATHFAKQSTQLLF